MSKKRAMDAAVYGGIREAVRAAVGEFVREITPEQIERMIDHEIRQHVKWKSWTLDVPYMAERAVKDAMRDHVARLVAGVRVKVEVAS